LVGALLAGSEPSGSLAMAPYRVRAP